MDQGRLGALDDQWDLCLQCDHQCREVQASHQSQERQFHPGDRWDQWDRIDQVGQRDPHLLAYPPVRVLPVQVKGTNIIDLITQQHRYIDGEIDR